MEIEHIQVDSKGKRIVIQGKSYDLLDLIYDIVTNRIDLLSFDNHLHNFLITLIFPKTLITNNQMLSKLMEDSSSSLTLKEEVEEDFQSILENSITPAATSSCRNNDLMTPVLLR